MVYKCLSTNIGNQHHIDLLILNLDKTRPTVLLQCQAPLIMYKVVGVGKGIGILFLFSIAHLDSLP